MTIFGYIMAAIWALGILLCGWVGYRGVLTTKVGFFVCAGLIGGAIIGSVGFQLATTGAVLRGAVGLWAGSLWDLGRGRRKVG